MRVAAAEFARRISIRHASSPSQHAAAVRDGRCAQAAHLTLHQSRLMTRYAVPMCSLPSDAAAAGACGLESGAASGSTSKPARWGDTDDQAHGAGTASRELCAAAVPSARPQSCKRMHGSSDRASETPGAPSRAICRFRPWQRLCSALRPLPTLPISVADHSRAAAVAEHDICAASVRVR